MANHDPIPNTNSIEELTHFWDTHDVTDYEEELVEVTEPVFVSDVKTILQLDSQEKGPKP